MRIRFTVLCLVVLLLAPNVTRAQATTELSAEQKAKIDAVFVNYDKTDSPGCALGLIKGGQLIYARGYGMANLEHGIPNGPKLVYDIGSTSKQFTAASIVLLAQQGKLTLDDEVRKWIPELPQYQRPVTIRHLLHHTSGLRDYLTLFNLAGVNFDDVTTEADALKIIARQKELNFTPGDEWLYSNSGFFLLSIIVKRASGKSLAEFARENIFEPLGMKHTLFLDNHKRIVPGRATGYSPAPKGGFQIEMSGFEQTGDGAVQTSVEDLLLWDRNFYEPKVGGAALLKQLLEKGVLNDGKAHPYALGLFVDDYKGLPQVSHGGSWAGYRAELMRFPEHKFSIACLCNLAASNPTGLAQQVADIYLADSFKPGKLPVKLLPGGGPQNSPAPGEAFAPSAERLGEFTGTYYSEELDTTYKLSVEDGKLTTANRNGNKRSLQPTVTDAFRAGGLQFVFQRNAKGEIESFGVQAGRTRNLLFMKQKQ